MTNAKPTILTLVTPSTSSKDLVNKCRQIGIEQATTDWVWLVDRDCVVDEAARLKAHLLISEVNDPRLAFIGGLYQSNPQQNLWQRSYNRRCNLWSVTHQIPLAGNVLIRKDLLPKDFDLSSIDFGNEEHHFKQVSIDHQLKIKIASDLKVFHDNKKSRASWFVACRSQSQFRSNKKVSFQNRVQFLVLVSISAKENIMETLFSTFYFAASGLLQRVPRFSKSIPNNSAPKL